MASVAAGALLLVDSLALLSCVVRLAAGIRCGIEAAACWLLPMNEDAIVNGVNSLGSLVSLRNSRGTFRL